jgi:hypothetical protein
MKLLLTLSILIICIGANAQSPFQSQPVLQPRNPNSLSLSAPSAISPLPTLSEPDSIVNAYRFGVAVSPAGYTLAGVYQAAAGISYGIQHQSYSYATQTYTVLWSASLVWIPINTATPINSLKDISSFGALFGIKNNLFNLGPFVNPNTPGKFKDKVGIWATTSINLNN